MAPRTPITRFLSFFLFAFVALLCIYHGTQSDSLRLTTYAKRALPDDATIQPRLDLGNELHLLSKRAPPKNRAEAAEKGRGYMCQLESIEPIDLDSELTDFQTFNNDWSPQPYGVSNGDPTETGSIIPVALAAKGLPINIGDRGLRGLIYYQGDAYKVGNSIYEATHAFYKATISTKAGYISAEENISPAHMIAQQMNGNPAPAISRLSDVYFLLWKEVAGKSEAELKNIKYFVRHHVINGHSLDVALEVASGKPLPPRGKDEPRDTSMVEEWPGKSYDMSTDDGKAILGTPNGAGVARFLMDHKLELGVKAPSKVTVFKTTGHTNADTNQPEDWIHFLFEISPVQKKKRRGRK
ncbi:hypothetical protein P875_00095127 [Aspergillus parasiticus SU-1]|uniref:Uncharacterized protein n=3 Tax=Aspergillus subgen. Circumdati TaxID=2720871 RepID=A0A5N6D1J2_ASPPA|nr:hypothetical protein BDV34DRAFT_233267 [Aspergillus parasiticus]KAE8306365.1 hypothetical protein BDV41DRAFT_585898 [Aspergillus transmontanensis]KJK62676.1 hypothetical protein P875_00095127 [Aspergillus parasiticus SU-1]